MCKVCVRALGSSADRRGWLQPQHVYGAFAPSSVSRCPGGPSSHSPYHLSPFCTSQKEEREPRFLISWVTTFIFSMVEPESRCEPEPQRHITRVTKEKIPWTMYEDSSFDALPDALRLLVCDPSLYTHGSNSAVNRKGKQQVSLRSFSLSV